MLVAGLSVSLLSLTPKVATAADDELSVFCTVYPATIPSSYGVWEPQRFWIPRLAQPGAPTAGPIRFTAAASVLSNRFTIQSEYIPTSVANVTVGNIEWVWMYPYTWYTCLGNFPNGLWLVFSTEAEGEAWPLVQEENPISDSTVTGGGNNGAFCIEYYNWWYDEYGYYQEEITGYECYGYEI